MKKTWIWVVVTILIAVSFLVYRRNRTYYLYNDTPEVSVIESENNTIPKEDKIVIATQHPGKTVIINRVSLKNSGFIRIVEDGYDDSQTVGVSRFLEPGVYENLEIIFNFPIIQTKGNKDAEYTQYLAQLYIDSNGNKKFDEYEDTHAYINNDYVESKFDVDVKAPDPKTI